MITLRLAEQMKVEEGRYEMTKIHEERTNVAVSYHVADDVVIYITNHPYLQNTPKKKEAETKAPYKNSAFVRQT
jgi:hypothetical protein